ncbi:MAG: hypothetical protein ABT15_06970 [Pseudonocardia sp. SCN 73-27]|nr:MAG: hypothetical protein ABS80_03350 [Pseudonocardia sp. SCN 72-51]ODV07813.1 MAG: hypothetical protein ABT15_06970 [Pseudonocardia sp. SCN 73-27]
MTDRSWLELVDTIAQNGRLVERLNAEHRPDNAGRCRVCRVAGTSLHAAFPCKIAELAGDARAVIRSRGAARGPG